MTNEEAIDCLKGTIWLGTKKQISRTRKAVDIAIDALEKADKYRWHDLRKNPEDLPEDFDQSEWFTCVHENHICDPYYPSYQYCEEYGFGYWKDIFDKGTFGYVDSVFQSVEELDYETIIAWRYIEPCEEDKP